MLYSVRRGSCTTFKDGILRTFSFRTSGRLFFFPPNRKDERMRIGLMTPGLSESDAISNDVVGMYTTIRARGFDTYIFTESGESSTALPTYHYADAAWLLEASDDLIMYHYCIRDDPGMKALRRMRCRLAVKYHNVTPSGYMTPYSIEFTRGTRMAREALAELVELPVNLFL